MMSVKRCKSFVFSVSDDGKPTAARINGSNVHRGCLMSASITFDQLEGRADRTLAVALWAKHVKNVVLCAFMMQVMNTTLKGLVASLTPERLDALTHEQASDLKKKLQNLHGQLSQLLTYPPVHELANRRLYKSAIAGLENSTEDLFDVIENLVLSENRDFRELLFECASEVKPRPAAESVGWM